LRGRLVEASDSEERGAVRRRFVALIENKNLSRNVLSALGHSPSDPLDSIVEEERSLVWKLVEVEKIVGLKDGEMI